MPKQCNNVLEAIGETPIVKLNRVTEGLQAAVYAKIEFMNPGGSIKDRVAIAMIEEAEKQGLLKPGGTIIEPTAGNTGVGLAMAAAVKGYRCIFVMPDKMSTEKIRLVKAYGAEVVITPASAESNSPEGYGGVSQRLCNEIPNSWRPDQFTNLVNPETHYKTTGPEIWRQSEGKVTVFVAGIGTGGSISGVGKYLKEQNPDIKVVAADPEGSILSGDKPKPWQVEGIGEDFVPKTLSAQVVDEWIRVSDQDSFNTARDLARREGLLLGGSCGTAMAAALRFAQRLGPDDMVVCLCPDTGRNYLSKLYSDEWMIEQGFMQAPAQTYTAGELLEDQEERELCSVSPEEPAEGAIVLFRKHGISQIPVIDDGKVVGCLRELTLARLLHAHMDPEQVPVSEIMARPMPTLDENTDLDEVYRVLSAGNSGVIILRAGKIAGIITRIDLIDFWGRRMERAPAVEAGVS